MTPRLRENSWPDLLLFGSKRAAIHYRYHGGFAQIIPGGPNPCQIFANISGGPVQGIDGSIFVEYDMEVAAGTTKTVAVDYKSF
jgi:hypothetical protein